VGASPRLLCGRAGQPLILTPDCKNASSTLLLPRHLALALVRLVGRLSALSLSATTCCGPHPRHLQCAWGLLSAKTKTAAIYLSAIIFASL